MRLTLTGLGHKIFDLVLFEREEEDEEEPAAPQASFAVEAASLTLGDAPPPGFVDRTAPGGDPFYPPTRYE